MTGPGRFITLEGIEGVGKSTCMGFVADYLARQGIAVRVTREPGGTPLGERIRAMVLDHSDQSLPAMAELLLIFAARSVHVENLIRPELAAGTWVVCDRFTDATFAYQGGGRGIEPAFINRLADTVHGNLWPDLTLLLDAPVETGLARRQQRGPADRIEAEQAAFFERARAIYLERQRAAPERIRLIDAAGPIEAVQNAIESALEDLIENIK